MKNLLTNGNSELAADGIFTWSIPALAAKLSDGKNFLVCSKAGICAQLCYARSGTYNFSNVKAAHTANLELTLADLDGWKRSMLNELEGKRYQPSGKPARYFDSLDLPKMSEYVNWWANAGGKAVRVHDSGDFYSPEYFQAWLDIARFTPNVLFYAYTKEVEMTRGYALPSNFILIYSMGGTQDHLVDKDTERHADVFPDIESLTEAGYTDQEHSDILAALLPTTRVGIIVNNIRHLKKKQGRGTFASLQEARDVSISM
jgi:Gene product 88